jgi:signal transduction histidine kinase
MPACLTRILLAAISLVYATAFAQADFVLRQDYFRDDTGKLQLSELPRDEFKPLSGVLSAGYGRDTIWIRILIDGRTTDSQKLIVRVRPPILDTVTIYDHEGGIYRTGDLFPGRVDEYRSANLNAKINAPSGTAEIFVSVQSETARPVLVEILSLEEAAAKDAIQLAIFSGYIIFVIISAILAIIHLSRNPERIVAWFTARQLSELAYVLFNLGIMRLVFSDAPRGLISEINNIANFMYGGVSISFVYMLVSEYHPLRASHYIFRGMLLFWVSAVVIYLNGATMMALELNLFIALATAFVLVPASIFTTPEKGKTLPIMPKSAMVGMCLVIAVLGAAAMLLLIGIVKGIADRPQVTLYTIFFHGFVTTLCISTFMYTRAVRLAAKQGEYERAIAVANINEQRERLNREEQEKLLSMLAHELRTPMSVMKMRLGPWLSDMDGVKELRHAIEEMSAVLDKTVQAGQMSSTALNLNLVTFELMPELQRASSCHEGRDIRIEADCLSSISSDPTLIRIVLNNLIENAVKYGSRLDPVIVKAQLETQGQLLRLSVVNSKSEFGIPDPRMVFTKYARGPHAHRRSGSGLGLFIVDTIAKRLGGSTFYHPQGDLIEFGILLPAHLEDDTTSPAEVA